MNFVKIRKSLNLSQVEMALLLGVAPASIRNWEQDLREPENAVITLYKLVEPKEQDVLVPMVTIACQKRYAELKDIRSLKKLITKVIQNKLLRSLLQVSILKSNSQWKPEELGFRVTKILM